VSTIDPDGLFGGDRMRRCSNLAQLHWPRFFLASDGFGRIEINYARILGKAYATFNPMPGQDELFGYIKEYAANYLLFPYLCDGQQWGQWDTRPECLPVYKTAVDKRSPAPDARALQEWKREYIKECKNLPQLFGKLSEGFHAIADGVEEMAVALPAGSSMVSAEWKQSDDLIAEMFPTTDGAFRRKIIEAAIQAYIGASTKNTAPLTDEILGRAIVKSTAEKQTSAALYLTRLPNFIGNQVRSFEKNRRRA